MNLFNIERSFRMKKERGWPELYICCDLHGTIIPSGKSSKDLNDYMEFYPYAKEVLQWFSNRPDVFLILWSSIPENRQPPVLNWFKEHGINFRWINENPHAKNTPRSDFSRKFYFSVLLDDRGGFEPEADWLAIKEMLIRIGMWCNKNQNGKHRWGIDGAHSNQYCKVCFQPKPNFEINMEDYGE
jgi:hypothetical protein